MRFRRRLGLALVSLLLYAPFPASGSEVPDPPAPVIHADGVSPHAGVDAIYRSFAEGYRRLDPAAVAGLYTRDALYLAGRGPAQRGREAIEAGFTGFFDAVRTDGGRLGISFEILDRQASDGLVADVGIYTLRRYPADGGESSANQGRFTVVAVPVDDGTWRLHVDSFTGLDPPRPGPDEPAGTTGGADGDPGIELHELRPGVWLHTSHRLLPGGTRFPSNGLAVADEDGLVLIDTAWGEVATVELLDRLRAVTGLPVRRAISTHFHYDRTAGADVLRARGVEVMAHPRTLRLASALGIPTPDTALEAVAEPGGHATVGPVEVFYPGAGHAEDNLVVWLPASRILFGGCAVRAGGTSSAGNIADADLESWPEAIRRVRARYPGAEVVVPGHGAPGGPELLDHTIGIVSAAVGPETAESPAEANAPMEFDTYQLVLLKRPAEPADLPEEELARVQAAHLAHLGRMAEEGHLVAAGPFGDQANEALRGLALYRVGSVDEARRLAEADPAVRAGRLEVEVLTWYTEKDAVAFPGAERYRRRSSDP